MIRNERMIVESARIAFGALAANKLRAALTMLGIIIGVAAVITLMSAGVGVQDYIARQFTGLGTNLLYVFPGSSQEPRSLLANISSSTSTLTEGDARALADSQRAPDILNVSPVVRQISQVVAGRENALTTVRGVTPNYETTRDYHSALGVFIREADLVERARVALIGQTVLDKLFPNGEYPIGRMIRIAGTTYRITGLLQKKGGTSFGDDDDVVVIPLTTAQERLSQSQTRRGERVVSTIVVQAVSQERMDAAAEQITTILRERHKINYRDEDDFTVFSQTDIINVFGDITSVITAFLGAIAGISLLVGGIGIMNIMFVSVTERTREIGIRKAVGAKRRDIRLQFLVEAVTLSVTGGLIGIAVGAAGAIAISRLVEGFRAVVTLDSVMLATGFSAAVGLFFGLYPAWRAGNLHPIDALRYE
jgi:putative ABC transport system permease protein